MNVAITSMTGGVGRSTIATILSGMRACRGRNVLLVDTGPWARLEMWGEQRREERLPRVDTVWWRGRELERNLRDGLSGYDDIIIDGQPETDADTFNALDFTDCVVVPVCLTLMSMEALHMIDHMVWKARSNNRGPRALAVVSRLTGDQEVAKLSSFRQRFRKYHKEIRLLNVVIHERTTYELAYSSGRTLEEIPVNLRVGEIEMAALYENIFEEKDASL